jgi:hypothetical protein
VLLHAFNHTPESLGRVAEAVREAHPASDILVPAMPTGTFSLADPEAIAADLVRGSASSRKSGGWARAARATAGSSWSGTAWAPSWPARSGR